MEFDLSDDQRLLQDSLRSALARACPLECVRAAVDRNIARDADIWSTVCELGVPALLVPEAHEGLGLTLLDAALAAEELGRCAAPVPFLGNGVLAPIALCEAGSAAQQSHWLPRIARGESVLGVCLTEALDGNGEAERLHVAQGRLHGCTLFAVDGVDADAYLVAPDDGTLHLVDAHAVGIECTALRAIDGTRPTVMLRFDGVEADALPGSGLSAIARLRDAAWVMLAADTLGAGWAMINQAVAYARERRQFGRAIGSFQAVKHLCAEMAAELEVTRALVWYAAHAFDERLPEAALYAAHAKALLGDAGQFVARTATEVFGGMGITDELGLHLWFKRIGFDRALYGTPHRVRRHAAALQEMRSG